MKRLSGLMTIAIGCLISTIGGCATSSTVKPARQPCEADAYASAHLHPAPSGVPDDWNKSIPFPPRATVAAVSDLQGVMRRVDFQTEGETYSELKTFYSTELRAAGYNVEKPVEQPELKTIDIHVFRLRKTEYRIHLSRSGEPKRFQRARRIRH
jgi:hypothetical protein